jgi:hypothetical protein
MSGETAAELPNRVHRSVVREMEAFCAEPRRSNTLRGRIRMSYRIEGLTVSLYEMRREDEGQGGWRRRTLARFRYAPGRRLWRFEREDRGGTWRVSGRVRARRRFRSLLRSYDRSSANVFWG